MDHQTMLDCLSLTTSMKLSLQRLDLSPSQLEIPLRLLEQTRLRLIHSLIHSPDLYHAALLQLQSLSRECARNLGQSHPLDLTRFPIRS